MSDQGKIVVLSGGVGGAKLVYGLSKVLPPDALLVVANTGDDFSHMGLRICPDIDSLTYALSDLADPVRGWGRVDETWNFMRALKQVGGEDWFNLGDMDLALHIMRSHLLQSGKGLTEATRILCRNLGVQTTILPMSDDPVPTMVDTESGQLSFQEYFVREQCQPSVKGFSFQGADTARLNPGLRTCFENDDVAAVLIAPSNPFVSIDPILAIGGFADMLEGFDGPVVAVSPIVGGNAIKGPAAKMMVELGLPSSALTVAQHYQDILTGFVLDQVDAATAPQIKALDIEAHVEQTMMTDALSKVSLARACLKAANVVLDGGG
ncbi:2-phospho-L-lactate transferase [Hwanghaeella sp. LZ110]|uniref:2-phospho-L-lactate transferase n=1 Tax=Hwanghaeella sp. LZ110 TaxID=3402810 RepID=UPI003B682373